jgi:hypothetical protein
MKQMEVKILKQNEKVTDRQTESKNLRRKKEEIQKSK